ncbi:cation transporter [Pseudomonas sp. LS1212]|uniref:heavy-metal-associated domain-containing protein n=1 Tax=Pseudomonas sp. LS1212 TaxID=2972478 RepID=UPI00215C200C|nr:cation transporter [Pseudomonas sp. LS1212]UVJ44602.1 cation transporter [Pseudomonas sp. LS1212]
MQVFNVQGMSCGHCVRAVTAAVKRQDESAAVEVDLGNAQVRVESSLSAEQIIGLISEEGYVAKAL